MFRGRTQNIPVATNPAGAECHLTSSAELRTIKTPGTMTLPRRDGAVIKCSLDGYKSARIIITPQSHTGLYGLFNMGFIGGIIDHKMGGPYILKPEKVNLILEREEIALPSSTQ